MKNNTGNKIAFILFAILTGGLLFYFLFSSSAKPAGDIVEYYGITESLINHGSINLTKNDQNKLENVFYKGFFNDPQYYITGKDGNRYPVHFIFYSILNIPVRIFLEAFSIDQLKTFAITNLLIFSVTAYIIMKSFLTNWFKKLMFLIIFYLSPLIWFIAWPGIDIYIACLLILATFYFSKGEFFNASILAILASWQSSALLLLALGFSFYYIYKNTSFRKKAFSFNVLNEAALLIFLISIPYIYNYLVFGTFSPWTMLQDGFTKTYGLGVQNINLKKTFEVFFDLNIGLFWYSPILLLAGIYNIIKSLKSAKLVVFIIGMIFLTIFAYQTNPSWHHGTSGFGPTRYSLFMIPFFIYFMLKYLQLSIKSIFLIALFILSQIYIFSFNGFLKPNFENTHYHTPYAKYVLNNYSWLYNPTPEIFFDRTNHTDNQYPASAIYKFNGKCKKAYILIKDIEKIKNECDNTSDFLEKINPFKGEYVDF